MKLIHKETGKEVPMGTTITITRITSRKDSDGKEVEKKEETEYKVTKDTVNDLIKEDILALDMEQEREEEELRDMMCTAMHIVTDGIMKEYDEEAKDKGFAILSAITEAYPIQSLCMMLTELSRIIRKTENIEEEEGDWYTLDFVSGEPVKTHVDKDDMAVFDNYPLFKTKEQLKKAMKCMSLMTKMQ